MRPIHPSHPSLASSPPVQMAHTSTPMIPAIVSRETRATTQREAVPLLRTHVLPGAIKPPRERVPATQVTRGTTPPVRHRPPRPNAHREPISLRATPHLASMRARDTSHPDPARPAKLHVVSEPIKRRVVRSHVMMRTPDTSLEQRGHPPRRSAPLGATNPHQRRPVALPRTPAITQLRPVRPRRPNAPPAPTNRMPTVLRASMRAQGTSYPEQARPVKSHGVGTYQAASGQVACDDADPGYFVGTTGASSQTLCPSGSYQPASAQTSCIATDPGNYSASAGATSQTQRAAGTYQPNANRTACIDASRGYFASGLGSTAQTPCSPGTFKLIFARRTAMMQPQDITLA